MNKLVLIMLTIITAILVAGGILYFTVLNTSGKENNDEPSIDEIIDHSVDIQEITTNMMSNDFIRISFKLQADSSKSKEEIEKRDFQIKNIIIKHLSSLTSDDLKGSEGKTKLEEDIKTKINGILDSGQVVQVYITSSILQ